MWPCDDPPLEGETRLPPEDELEPLLDELEPLLEDEDELESPEDEDEPEPLLGEVPVPLSAGVDCDELAASALLVSV